MYNPLISIHLKWSILGVLTLLIHGCSTQEERELTGSSDLRSEFIAAADISMFPEMRADSQNFYDAEGNRKDLLEILTSNGINTIRLRLWVHPNSPHSGFEEVRAFSSELREKGFKTWLTVHYSDTWADPGQQTVPQRWSNLSFTALRDSVLNYTRKVAREIRPDIIQIGNEINSGLLHPFGHRTANQAQFKNLLEIAISAVRSQSPNSRIMLHFAGISGSEDFFGEVNNLDFDLIGLSYYPMWHGKSLPQLKNSLQTLSEIYARPVIIAETAYPFTLNWNDWTNNIAGLDSHLILPEYPASPDGQFHFLTDLKELIQEVNGGNGLCYWAPEWIAWKGAQATEGSPWENQALFDFDSKALPALSVFNTD